MKAFMDENFLLETGTAQRLYHNYAEKMPILDYHCHIHPREIYENKTFENIAQLWLSGDHYKWRQMRSNGVPERLITGNAKERDKFQAWAETLERAIGNPLYHWSHLELQRYFGYHGVLNARNAQEVWNLCNAKLSSDGMGARDLILKSHVTLLCTTDDPNDSLEWHQKLAEDSSFPVQVLPAWRPDRVIDLEKPDYLDYLQQLRKTSHVPIHDFASLVQALLARMDYFASMGCRISDHGLSYVAYAPASQAEVEAILAKRMEGVLPNEAEQAKYKTACMLALGRAYRARNWVMQLHYGVKRDNRRRLFERLGPDAGIDCIRSDASSAELADFLNALDETGTLPKTIIYSLNPVDNAAIGTVIGCFQEAPAAGKLQQGSAWWFNDHKEGMQDQMISLANLGLLGNFIGMLTDSRSFLSYTRHEYFRRILCNLIGGWVENGEYPNEEEAVGKMVQDICYWNAVRYFGFDIGNKNVSR